MGANLYSNAVLADAPVAYYPCNDGKLPIKNYGSGGSALDIGTAAGTPDYQRAGGMGSYGIHFSRAENEELTGTLGAQAVSTGDHAFEAWFKVDSLPEGLVWLEHGWSSPDSGGFCGVNTDNSLYLGRGGVGTASSNAGVVTLGVQTHVVVSWNSATTAASFYRNGLAVGGQNLAAPLTNSAAFVIGGLGNFPNGCWEGEISHCAYYTKQIPASRVMTHYSEGLRQEGTGLLLLGGRGAAS